MAGIDMGTGQAVVPTAGRSVDYDKEVTGDGGPCQLHARLVADMSDGTTRRARLTINPGWLRDHGLHLVACENCDGTGEDSGQEDGKCAKCGGSGKVENPQRAYENLAAQLADRAQSELDKLDTWIMDNVPKTELRDLFK